MKRRDVDDRLVFPPGEQKKFMLAARQELSVSWAEIAVLINAHPRSVRDWAREKYTIAQHAAHRLAEASGVSIPSAATVLVWKDHLQTANQEGWRQMRAKNGPNYRIPINEEYRQEKWRQWWENKGKYLPSPINNKPLRFQKPLVSEELAEFVGIMLGDGGISNYQLVVTLHRFDDAAYSMFVRNLIFKLFNIKAGKYAKKDELADNILISRIGMVNYFVHELGLKIGNKVQQQVDIPPWIKQNKKLLTACIRGLIDTDGCVFTHRYKVKGKNYSYKKISYTSASIPLSLSVYETLRGLGIQARLAPIKSRNVNDVRIDSIESVSQYFKKVGSHNPKHLMRYLE